MSDAAQMALRYDVNLSILFTELPLLQRPAAAAAAGFDAVELWWPFPEPVPSDRDLDQLRDAILDSGTRLVGLNFDAGNMAAGDRGLLSRPADSERFRANIDVAVGFAASLGCTVLNALYGNWDPESSVPEQRETATENLVLAARSAERAGATIVIEALNSIESPDYPITSSHEALDLIEYLRVIHDVPNIAFLADLYHLARMGEPVEQLIERRADRFGTCRSPIRPAGVSRARVTSTGPPCSTGWPRAGTAATSASSTSRWGRAPTASAGSPGTSGPPPPSRSPYDADHRDRRPRDHGWPDGRQPARVHDAAGLAPGGGGRTRAGWGARERRVQGYGSLDHSVLLKVLENVSAKTPP